LEYVVGNVLFSNQLKNQMSFLKIFYKKFDIE